MSFLIFQVAVLFLPGLIWASIDAKYVAKRDLPQFQLLLNAFLFGIFTYTLLFVLMRQWGHAPAFLGAFDETTEKLQIGKAVDEIALAVALSFALSVGWVYLGTYKVFNRALQKIAATKKFGDEDVWDFVFNSNEAAVEYVNVRDFSKKIVYSGWVKVFSDRADLRELVLRDVKVYDFDATPLFDMPLVYVARKKDDVDIEFPYRP
ncbi:MAG: hypothetical protein JNL71_01965 [Rhodospirillales bacterium]|nr:hypothetical protein [Rhodospirillales bacterium]